MGEIICGNCIEEMKKLDKNSVDSVITDPPYGLAFMGKLWDDFEPEEYQKFSEKWGEQALRVLKPGGYLLAFSGTRTYHRMVVGLEDARFVVKDQIDWIYGCVPKETEILTKDGWKSYEKISCGDDILSFNPEEKKIESDEIIDVFEYNYEGDMVRLKNDNTNQLLTPNHKIYCKEGYRKQKDGVREYYKPENWSWQYASEIKDYGRYELPLGSIYDGNFSIGEDFASLLGWIVTEGSFYEDSRNNYKDIRIYQSDDNINHVLTIERLLERLEVSYSRYEREREYNGEDYVEYCFCLKDGDVRDKIYDLIPEKKPTNRLLNLTYDEKLALYNSMMMGDGSKKDGEKYICFYQDDMDVLIWFQTLCHLIGKQARINKNKMCVQVHNNSTTELQARHLEDRGENYEGVVWCPKTKNGTWIARYKGRIFITGNSGFPKSKDISKAIDKKFLKEKLTEKLGHKPTREQFKQAWEYERKIVGIKAGHEGFEGRDSHSLNDGWDRPWTNDSDAVKKYHSKTAPATFEAERWDGWGTALKPSHEPIVLAQKPREGTYAENVLERGVGGLNIDGCRIEHDEPVKKTDRKKNQGNIWDGENTGLRNNPTDLASPSQKGRWPANVVLDPKSSKLLDEQSGEKARGHWANSKVTGYGDKIGNGKVEYSGVGRYANDSGGASRFFYSAKAQKSERNAGLEDLEDVNMGQSGGARQKLKEGKDEYQQENPSVGLNKIKKVKNDIATLKPINLMRWLVRLVTPPNGTVLDPFAGSGTTGCACEVEGFDYILIEKRERFANVIAPKRCEYWSKEKNWSELKVHEELDDPTKKKVKSLKEFF